MVKNIWNNIDFYCMKHDSPIKLEVYAGSSSPFYACPKYMLKDDEHPNGHDEYETACSNRLSFYEAEKVVEEISKRIEKDLANNEIANYAGMPFSYEKNGTRIDCKVLEYSLSKGITKVGVLNKRQIGSWREIHV